MRRTPTSDHALARATATSRPCVASFNEVRMTPRDADGQMLLSHQLQVSPRASVQAYVDYWGALVQSFDVHEEHDVLEIVATSPRRRAAAGTPRRRVRPGATSPTPAVTDRWGEFLVPTALVDDATVDAVAREHRRGRCAGCRRPPRPSVRPSRRPARRSGTTTAPPASPPRPPQAWAIGGGVCQDYSHTLLSLLRAVGIPARYVSGYLHDEEEAPGRTVVGESHAWVEVVGRRLGGVRPHQRPQRRRGPRRRRPRPRLRATFRRSRASTPAARSESLGVTVEITQLER